MEDSLQDTPQSASTIQPDHSAMRALLRYRKVRDRIVEALLLAAGLVAAPICTGVDTKCSYTVSS